MLLRALAALVCTRLELWVVPFSILRKRPRVSCVPGPDAESVAWAIAAASRIVPRATCLVKALATHRLLAGFGHASDLCIGVAKGTSRFGAHAWVEFGGAVLVGGTDTEYVRLVRWGVTQ